MMMIDDWDRAKWLMSRLEGITKDTEKEISPESFAGEKRLGFAWVTRRRLGPGSRGGMIEKTASLKGRTCDC